MPLRDMLRASQLNLRVTCPNCQVDMTIKTVFPAVHHKDFLEITYVCPTCKGEIERYFRPDSD